MANKVNDEILDLTDCYLINGNMNNLDCADSIFVRADLRGTTFRCSVLTNCDFTDANLTGCDFTGAITDGSKFDGATMDGVIGL